MPISRPAIPTQRKPCDLPSIESTKSFWHTEPSPLLLGHHSTRSLPGTADVVVIGSGMTGTSIAHHLVQSSSASKQPLRVVLLEAREACWGATGRNGGHCQPLLFTHPEDPSIGYFELANFAALQDLINEKDIDCEFVSQPGVQATYDSHGVKTIQASLKTMESTSPELLKRMKFVTSPEELAALRVPTAKAAVVTDIAARMWPYKFVSRILEDLLNDHADTFNLQTLTPVTQLSSSSSSGVKVHTARGNILAKKVICATNAYTSHLLPSFAPLIVPVRGQMSALKPFASVSGLSNRLRTSLGFSSSGEEDYLIQRPTERGEHLMFGGGRSHGGRTVGTTDDSTIDPETEIYLRESLPRVLGLPESGKAMDAVNMWTGIMGFSRDERPWVGDVGDGVFVAAGFSGHGMPNTWLCGKAISELVEKSLDGVGKEEAVKAVCMKLGLPKSYLFSEERVKAALRDWDDVESQDWDEIERGRMAMEV